MAITMIVQNSQEKDYHGKMTLFVVLVSVVAATGGLIFGYDIGISGNIIIYYFLYCLLSKVINSFVYFYYL